MIKPPRVAPPPSPELAAALEAAHPSRTPRRPADLVRASIPAKHQGTFRDPSDPRVNPSPDELRARAQRFDAAHNPPANDSEKPDEGKVLARIPRPDGTEQRVSMHTFNGAPFVRVGLWQRGRDGVSMWPVKGKAATVRVRELGAVVKGLCDAMEDLGVEASKNGTDG